MSSVTIISVFFACILGANAGSLCLRPCPQQDINPICATNGEVKNFFLNECELQNAECADGAVWKKIKVEECLVILSAPIARAEEKPTIVNIPCGLCTMNYSPVCGYDGNEFKVFGNGCTLNQQNCLAKINASEGEEVSSFLAVEPEKCNIKPITFPKLN
ncbi:unnamed protein product [Hermetia illucens]|uniref:Kazal-like domain-containing protein n=1 Tax=Hermetia illucens TaxID=343691 RepID=A0A7R8UPV3_HERIL|nr:unnamed protein product [Hermetia illucens]